MVAEPVRAQKAIANSGLMSRRSAEEAIAAGRVAVDGHPIGLGDRGDVSARLLTSAGPARALAAHIVSRHQNETIVEMVLGEGRNRVIRRMFEAIGHEVIRLVRTAIGPLSDQSLQPGESRLLSIEEIRR